MNHHSSDVATWGHYNSFWTYARTKGRIFFAPLEWRHHEQLSWRLPTGNPSGFITNPDHHLFSLTCHLVNLPPVGSKSSILSGHVRFFSTKKTPLKWASPRRSCEPTCGRCSSCRARLAEYRTLQRQVKFGYFTGIIRPFFVGVFGIHKQFLMGFLFNGIILGYTRIIHSGIC